MHPALLSVVRSDVYTSDNVSGADNQQERLIELRGWVIGFVDGEGCFSIGFVRQPSPARPKRLHDRLPGVSSVCRNTGDEESRLSRGASQVLRRRPDLRQQATRPNHREHLCQFIVERRTELLETVIPFFRTHPLRTSKQLDFEKFAHCVELTDTGQHLRPEGLIEIAEIAQTMNHRKPRQELIRILRGHTPDVRDIG